MSAPITWVHPNSGTGVKKVTTRAPDGSLIVDSYPHTAPPPKDHPLAARGFRRWEKMVDSYGHVVRACLTGASSSYDTNSSYSQYQKAKMRHKGWIPYGECPKAQLLVGAIDPYSLIPANRDGAPCVRGTFDNGEGRAAKGPCDCVKAEIAARRASNLRDMNKLERKYQTEQSKTLDAQAKSAETAASSFEQLAAAQLKQTELMAKVIDRMAVDDEAKPAAKRKAKAAPEPEANEE